MYVCGFLSGHGDGGDDGDDEEEKMEKYKEAKLKWRRVTRKLLCKKVWSRCSRTDNRTVPIQC